MQLIVQEQYLSQGRNVTGESNIMAEMDPIEASLEDVLPWIKRQAENDALVPSVSTEEGESTLRLVSKAGIVMRSMIIVCANAADQPMLHEQLVKSLVPEIPSA